MKIFNIITVILLHTFVFISCEDINSDNENNFSDEFPKIQFYADPALYNKAYTGLVVTSISINNVSYKPKFFIDYCTESYKFPVSGVLYDRNYLKYKIYIQNYNSLDAIMNNLPFASETYEGVLYEDTLLDGCNTLQVVPGYGSQQHALVVK